MQIYKSQSGSPIGITITRLLSGITPADNTIIIQGRNILPAGPNIATIGAGEITEIIRYETKTEAGTNTTLTGITRGYASTPKPTWEPGAPIARDFTSYDHYSFIKNTNAKSSGVILVAANDCPDIVKLSADYVCGAGNNDQDIIKQAIDAMVADRPDRRHMVTIKCVGNFVFNNRLELSDATGEHSYSYLRLDMTEATFTWYNTSQNGVYYMFYFSGGWTNTGIYSGTITGGVTHFSPIASGEREIELTSAAHLSIGDYIWIWGPYQPPEQFQQNTDGEIHRVVGIDGNTITIDTGAWMDYPTVIEDGVERGVEIVKLVTLHHLHIIGGTYRGADARGLYGGKTEKQAIASNTRFQGIAMQLNQVSEFMVERGRYENVSQHAIACQDSHNGIIRFNGVYGSNLEGGGYGIGFHGACNNLNIHNNLVQYCRHAIVGGDGVKYGSPMYINISNNVFYGGMRTMQLIDCHSANSYGVSFNYNVITSTSNAQAFWFRVRELDVIGNHINIAHNLFYQMSNCFDRINITDNVFYACSRIFEIEGKMREYNINGVNQGWSYPQWKSVIIKNNLIKSAGWIDIRYPDEITAPALAAASTGIIAQRNYFYWYADPSKVYLAHRRVIDQFDTTGTIGYEKDDIVRVIDPLDPDSRESDKYYICIKDYPNHYKAWENDKVYVAGDVVYASEFKAAGKHYKCIVGVGPSMTSPEQDKGAHWVDIAWVSTEEYVIGDIVWRTTNNKGYICLANNTNVAPETDVLNAYWSYIGVSNPTYWDEYEDALPSKTPGDGDYYWTKDAKINIPTVSIVDNTIIKTAGQTMPQVGITGIHMLIISGNILWGQGSEAIKLTGCGSGIVTGNIINDCVLAGISLANCHRMTVSGNSIVESRTTYGQRINAPIKIVGGNNNIVKNNNIHYACLYNTLKGKYMSPASGTVARINRGTHKHGSAIILAGNTSVTVKHNMGSATKRAFITSMSLLSADNKCWICHINIPSWNASATYEVGDIVRYDTQEFYRTYVCKVAHAAPHIPGTTDGNTYWDSDAIYIIDAEPANKYGDYMVINISFPEASNKTIGWEVIAEDE